MDILKSKTILILLFILSLPILLFVYRPLMQLGGFGFFLGMIGMFISPVIIFGLMIYLIIRSFKK